MAFVRLGDIAEVFRGASTSGRSIAGSGAQTVPMINIRDLGDRGIDPDSVEDVRVKSRSRARRYQVQTDDVLITCRGTVLKTALVPPELQGHLVSSNLIVIRLDQRVLRAPLLKAYFETHYGQRELSARLRGTVVFTIRPRDIRSLQVPIPPAEVQERLSKLIRAADKYMELLARQRELWESLVTHVVSQELAGIMGENEREAESWQM